MTTTPTPAPDRAPCAAATPESEPWSLPVEQQLAYWKNRAESAEANAPNCAPRERATPQTDEFGIWYELACVGVDSPQTRAIRRAPIFALRAGFEAGQSTATAKLASVEEELANAQDELRDRRELLRQAEEALAKLREPVLDFVRALRALGVEA